MKTKMVSALTAMCGPIAMCAVFALFPTLAFAQIEFSNFGESHQEKQEHISNPENPWAFGVDLHGGPNREGLGLSFETPALWNFVSAGLSYSFDSVTDATDSDFSWGTLQPSIKLRAAGLPKPEIIPYAKIGFDYYMPVKTAKETGGNRNGLEFVYGAEWRFTDSSFDHRLTYYQSIFFEFGWTNTTFRSEPGGTRAANGSLSRFGLRRFF